MTCKDRPASTARYKEPVVSRKAVAKLYCKQISRHESQGSSIHTSHSEAVRDRLSGFIP
jgi:hypothetical protein